MFDHFNHEAFSLCDEMRGHLGIDMIDLMYRLWLNMKLMGFCGRRDPFQLVKEPT